MAVSLTIRTAIYLILGIIFFLLMFPLATKTFTSVPQAYSDAECRASVEWHAKTNVDIFDVESPLPLECTTKTIFLKYDKSGRKKDEILTSVTPTYYISKGDTEKIKRIFAEAISICLWNMLDGSKPVFTAADKVRCAICSDIIIDKEIVDPAKGNIKILANFDSFLQSNKFSKTKENYGVYLNIATVPTEIPIADSSGNPISYTVFYAATNEEKWTRAERYILYGGIIGMIYGYFTQGEGTWIVDIEPINEVSTECQGLY